jgi:hypothetical protein
MKIGIVLVTIETFRRIFAFIIIVTSSSYKSVAEFFPLNQGTFGFIVITNQLQRASLRPDKLTGEAGDNMAI